MLALHALSRLINSCLSDLNSGVPTLVEGFRLHRYSDANLLGASSVFVEVRRHLLGRQSGFTLLSPASPINLGVILPACFSAQRSTESEQVALDSCG